MVRKHKFEHHEEVPSYLKDDGYLYVMLIDANGKGHEHAVHILVAEAFLGPAPSPAHRVAHKNGKLTDNAAANLEWRVPGRSSAPNKPAKSASRKFRNPA